MDVNRTYSESSIITYTCSYLSLVFGEIKCIFVFYFCLICSKIAVLEREANCKRSQDGTYCRDPINKDPDKQGAGSFAVGLLNFPYFGVHDKATGTFPKAQGLYMF